MGKTRIQETSKCTYPPSSTHISFSQKYEEQEPLWAGDLRMVLWGQAMEGSIAGRQSQCFSTGDHRTSGVAFQIGPVSLQETEESEQERRLESMKCRGMKTRFRNWYMFSTSSAGIHKRSRDRKPESMGGRTAGRESWGHSEFWMLTPPRDMFLFLERACCLSNGSFVGMILQVTWKIYWQQLVSGPWSPSLPFCLFYCSVKHSKQHLNTSLCCLFVVKKQ